MDRKECAKDDAHINQIGLNLASGGLVGGLLCRVVLKQDGSAHCSGDERGTGGIQTQAHIVV